MAGWAILLVAAVGVASGIAYSRVVATTGGGVVLSGKVVDARSQEGVPDARVVYSTGAGSAAEDGSFRLENAALVEMVRVEASGYLSSQGLLLPGVQAVIAVEPRTTELEVVDARSGLRVERASVQPAVSRAEARGQGRFVLSPAVVGDRVVVRAPGYREAMVELGEPGFVRLPLQPLVQGRVVDLDTRAPVAGAVVSDGQRFVIAGPDGSFQLDSDAGRLQVIAPGYRRVEVRAEPGREQQVAMKRFTVRGLYVSFGALSERSLWSNILDLVDRTEVNALVIDVKGDRGYLSYRSQLPLADMIGANDVNTVPDIAQLLSQLKARGVYTIARIVVFKDDKLARNGYRAGLDVAIIDGRTGGPWTDGEGLGWVDPFRREVWEYNIAVALEAVHHGFEEVQFDYIRFPTDPGAHTSLDAARYSQEPTEANKASAVVGFLAQAREELRRAGALLSIDVFGYVTMVDEVGIGQRLEALAHHVDYLSPMVYPSTYQAGIPGGMAYPDVVRQPYEVVYQSIRRARERLAGVSTPIRPWLQYFDDYPWATGLRYGPREIAAQKRAAEEAGALGWMLWDPFNRYDRGGLTLDAER